MYNNARGRLLFVNQVNIYDAKVQRFYNIVHDDVSVIRAWQAHKAEEKWLHVTKETFKIVIVKIDNRDIPSDNLPYKEYTLTANNPQILHIPGGYANGFKAVEAESIMTIFSNYSLEQSNEDSFRFDANRWYCW